MMSESILQTIKKMIGLDEGYEAFDVDIIVFINAAIMILIQLGVVTEEGFTLEDGSQTWSDLITDEKMLGAVKGYICLRVRKDFDPPANGTVMDAMDKSIKEYEWRLNVMVDPGKKE